MFETKKANSRTSSNNQRASTLPHPFVLEPPSENNRIYNPDDFFDMRLTLFGDSIHHLPYLVYCIEQMGQDGLGAKLKGRRGKFKLISIFQKDQKIYDHSSGILDQSHQPEILAPDWPADEPVSKIKIRLETPLRLKFNNRLTSRISFHILIRACLRRISHLEETFANGEPDLDYRNLIVLAKNIHIEKSNFKWQEISRYSNRQKTGMQIGGVTGTAVFTGDITPFMPLLAYCEKTHIGKQTAFGLGKITVIPVPDQ